MSESFSEMYERLKSQKMQEFFPSQPNIPVTTEDSFERKVDKASKITSGFILTLLLFLSVCFNVILWEIHTEAMDFRASPEYTLWKYKQNPSKYKSFMYPINEAKGKVCQ